MKLLILFLLGTVAFGYKGQQRVFSKLKPEKTSRRRLKGTSIGGKRSLADYARQQKDRCELLSDDAGLNRLIARGQAIIGDCPGKHVRSIVLVRDEDDTDGGVGDTWVYTTHDPRKAYDDIVDFLRQQSHYVDDGHPIEMNYSYKTRDGFTRVMRVRNDMDLWAAFLLQEKFPNVEVRYKVATIAPSAQPTTATPSHSPTTASPTEPINSRIFGPDGHEWMNSMLKKLNLYMARDPLYRRTQHGKTSTIFRGKASYNGPWVALIKTKNGHVFGAYNDIQWTNGGGSYFYCDECFLWILKGREFSKYKSLQFQNYNYATYHHTSYGPCFGGGHDMCITAPNKSGDASGGYTNMGQAYKPPGTKKYPYYIDSTSKDILIPEWEVFPVYSLIGMNSRIITKADDIKWLNSVLPTGKKIGNVCYRFGGGFGKTSTSTTHFRNGCSKKGPWVFTAKTKLGNVFGAYSGIDWSTSSSGYQKTTTSFLYILKDKKFTRTILKLKSGREGYATYMNTSYGPCFGAGHDMCVSSPSSPSGYGSVGNTYETPDKSSTYYMDSSSKSYTFVDWEVHLIEDE